MLRVECGSLRLGSQYPASDSSSAGPSAPGHGCHEGRVRGEQPSGGHDVGVSDLVRRKAVSNASRVAGRLTELQKSKRRVKALRAIRPGTELESSGSATATRAY